MIRIEVKGGQNLPQDVSRANWAGLMTDIPLFRPVLEDICAALDLQLNPDLAAGYPGSSAVFVIDEQVVIKLYPSIFAADFAVEQAVYELLNGRIDAMPALLASGTYKDRIEWPFLVFQFCSGQPIREIVPHLTSGDKIRIAQQVGAVLQAVYQTAVIPQAPFTPWPDFLMQRYHNCLRELRESTSLPPNLISQIESFLTGMLPELRRERGLLLNADLTDDHAFIYKVDSAWQLQAIIDWADAEIGPPVYEWIAAWYGFCRMEAAMFRALVAAATPGQPFDDLFKRKLLACTFLHRFGSLIIRERWQAAPAPADLSLQSLGAWLWPGILD